MPPIVEVIVVCNLSVCGIIALHECGHYLAGGLVGVPWTSMRIRLFRFPQHIALKAGDRWLSPISDHKDFEAAAMGMLRTRFHRLAFVAGGLLLQTAVFLTVMWLLINLSAPRIWLLSVASTLTAMPLVYLAADFLVLFLRRKSLGDFSALWKISPVASLSVAGVVLAAHCGVLVFALTSPRRPPTPNHPSITRSADLPASPR